MSDAERLTTVETNELIAQGEDVLPQLEVIPTLIKISVEGLGTQIVDPAHFVYKPVGVFLDGALSENQVLRKESDPNAPDPEPRDLLVPYGKINYVEFFFEENEVDGDSTSD